MDEETRIDFENSFSLDNIKILVKQGTKDFGGDFLRKFQGQVRWVNVRLLLDPALTMYYQAGFRTRSTVGPTEHGWDIGGMELSHAFMDEAAKMNFLEMARGYGGDVLAIHGGEDEQIPVEVVYRYKNLYGEKFRFTIIEGANHQFSSIPWKEQVYRESIAFITKFKK